MRPRASVAIAVFPARAGMILGETVIGPPVICIPRESGDDPDIYEEATRGYEYSPRERG